MNASGAARSSNTASPAVAPSGTAKSKRLVRFIRVRLSRKLWATYRVFQRNPFPRVLAMLLGGYMAGAAANGALPTGAQVTSGQATVNTPTANQMTITQGSQRATLNWQSFNIGAGNTVQFVQPGASSVALNRVVGNNPSSIYGNLNANGQVFLLNPQGVYFSSTARIDTGAFVASTLSLSDADFNAGVLTLRGTGNGLVRNQGQIKVAPGGFALLAGAQVVNEGTISAAGASVGLAAGSRVAIDRHGDGLVTFQVEAGALGASVSNSGTIAADGGRVALTAHDADAAMATVVNQSGIVRANTVSESNGIITLSGGPAGIVQVTGTLQAAGTEAGQTGGTIKVLGDKVGLFDGTRIDASGQAGGGTVLVGGNFQGKGPEQNASATYVAPDARINADAVQSGKGGTVIVWADNTTRFYGDIGARGGSMAGDGGFAEVSGKQYLVFQGTVDASAPKGKAGTLLLDPTDIRVVVRSTLPPRMSCCRPKTTSHSKPSFPCPWPVSV